MYQIHENRVARFAYDKFKQAYQIKEGQMFGKIVADRNATIQKFADAIQALRPDLKVSNSSGYIAISSKSFPCKWITGFKDICSFDMNENTVNFRRKAAPKVTKQIKFRKELTPAKLVKYIERFSEK